MSYLLAYLILGVAVTALRFSLMLLVARHTPEARDKLHQSAGCGLFVASVAVWPLDVVFTVWKFFSFALSLASAYRTAKRMGVTLK